MTMDIFEFSHEELVHIVRAATDVEYRTKHKVLLFDPKFVKPYWKYDTEFHFYYGFRNKFIIDYAKDTIRIGVHGRKRLLNIECMKLLTVHRKINCEETNQLWEL